jgi:hypothetical protein
VLRLHVRGQVPQQLLVLAEDLSGEPILIEHPVRQTGISGVTVSSCMLRTRHSEFFTDDQVAGRLPLDAFVSRVLLQAYEGAASFKTSPILDRPSK